MLTLKNELLTFFLIIIATGVSLFVLVQRDNKMSLPVFSATIPLIATPTPTVVPPGPIQVTTMDSPDGTKKLTMKKQKIQNIVKYSFFTSDKSGTSEKVIFEKEESPSQSLSIPYNAWSPNNMYFFLKEATPIVNNYYVFYVSGSTFPDNSKYANIQDLFVQKVPQYIIEDVTGWADPNLLIVNAKTDKGEQGPSFWFDVTTQSFIQLGTRFN